MTAATPQPVVAHGRYHLIDALRGLSILLMVGYHLGIQLTQFMGAPQSLVQNPILSILQPVFGGLFILLSGMSCYFSRSNVKRGLKTLACAVLVSVVMGFSGFPVWFGILHFLGCAILLYAALGKWLTKTLGKWQPLVYGVLFAGSFPFFPRYVSFTPLLMPLGLYREWGNDYFPLVPWFFLFLLGTWLGQLTVAGKLPRWFYSFQMPILPWIGRHTLIIYLAHQPIILGALWLLQQLGV